MEDEVLYSLAYYTNGKGETEVYHCIKHLGSVDERYWTARHNIRKSIAVEELHRLG